MGYDITFHLGQLRSKTIEQFRFVHISLRNQQNY